MIRLFVVFESHGAVWESANVAIHDKIRGFALSGAAPKPTIAPTKAITKAITKAKAKVESKAPKHTLPPGVVRVDKAPLAPTLTSKATSSIFCFLYFLFCS